MRFSKNEGFIFNPQFNEDNLFLRSFTCQSPIFMFNLRLPLRHSKVQRLIYRCRNQEHRICTVRVRNETIGSGNWYEYFYYKIKRQSITNLLEVQVVIFYKIRCTTLILITYNAWQRYYYTLPNELIIHRYQILCSRGLHSEYAGWHFVKNIKESRSLKLA